jgi:hypothetical protein
VSPHGTVRRLVEESWEMRRARGINPYLDPIQMYQMLLVLADRLDAISERVLVIESPGWKPKRKKEAKREATCNSAGGHAAGGDDGVRVDGG